MKIVYENHDGTICIITPTYDALEKQTIEQIAVINTPTGLSFWIRDDSDIPTDRGFRDAWEIDPAWGEPDGIGGV